MTSEQVGSARITVEEMERVRPALLAFAKRLANGDVDLAEDLVQNALCQGFRKQGQYDPARGEVGKWLAGILVNQARDYRRKASSREQPSELSDRESGDEFEQGVLANAQLRAMLARLSGRPLRAAKLLADGHGHREVARMLAMPWCSYQAMLRQMAKRLRDFAPEG